MSEATDNIVLVKAFTKDALLGNPAGVVTDATGLSDEQMQKIASEMGFSECAFVFPSDVADYKFRYFAPKSEVDFCGHATIAAINTLSKGVKQEICIETRAGVYGISVQSDGKIMIKQDAAKFGEIFEQRSTIAHAIGLNVEDIVNSPIQSVMTSYPVIVVPVRSRKILDSIDPKFDEITKFSDVSHGSQGFSVYSIDDSQLTTRFFHPQIGIDEDPATGVAAGPVAAHALKYQDFENDNVSINQGASLGKRSTLYVNMANGFSVGGYAVGFGVESVQKVLSRR